MNKKTHLAIEKKMYFIIPSKLIIGGGGGGGGPNKLREGRKKIEKLISIPPPVY